MILGDCRPDGTGKKFVVELLCRWFCRVKITAGYDSQDGINGGDQGSQDGLKGGDDGSGGCGGGDEGRDGDGSDAADGSGGGGDLPGEPAADDGENSQLIWILYIFVGLAVLLLLIGGGMELMRWMNSRE